MAELTEETVKRITGMSIGETLAFCDTMERLRVSHINRKRERAVWDSAGEFWKKELDAGRDLIRRLVAGYDGAERESILDLARDYLARE